MKLLQEKMKRRKQDFISGNCITGNKIEIKVMHHRDHVQHYETVSIITG